MSAQFKIKAADPASVVRLERELGLPRFIAATLVARGIDNPAAVHRFLAPSLERDWLDPYIIPGLSDVADALEAAVKRGDHILVFGDFDLDGISATTVLTRGLRALGAQATAEAALALARQAIAIAQVAEASANDLSNAVGQNTSKIATLWDAVFSDITSNPFQITFADLTGITLKSGVWNASLQRLEC